MKYFSFSIVLCILLSGATTVHAATLSFDPQEQVVGLHTPFQVGLLLTSTEAVNTVHISLVLPDGITPVTLSDGDSIINFWLTRPVYDEASHTLTFEGIIPGGFSGVGGRLLLLTLQATRPGTAVISVNTKASSLYRNTADGAPEPLDAQTLTLRVSSTKENILNELPDAEPPEEFTPLISRSPEAYGGKWILTFATQDKGSGVDHYEVRESVGLAGLLGLSSWHSAESPYVLSDQRLASSVSVRSIDAKGNVRSESVAAVYPLPWYANTWVSYILIAGALLLIFTSYALIRRNHHAKSLSL